MSAPEKHSPRYPAWTATYLVYLVNTVNQLDGKYCGPLVILLAEILKIQNNFLGLVRESAGRDRVPAQKVEMDQLKRAYLRDFPVSITAARI